jgi:hypothetical protein
MVHIIQLAAIVFFAHIVSMKKILHLYKDCSGSCCPLQAKRSHEKCCIISSDDSPTSIFFDPAVI